jgi:hypothetical protein
LARAWKKLLDNEKTTPEVENCETEDYRDTLQRGGEESVSLDDVEAKTTLASRF